MMVNGNQNYQTDSSIVVPNTDSVYLMGSDRGVAVGLSGAVSVFLVNKQMVDLTNDCSNMGDIDTVFSVCDDKTCGHNGKCASASTMQGYYCLCYKDGLPSLSCKG